MTIKQAAEKYSISPQAVYQRLKKRGINVNTLMDKETQELTPEGEMILDKLFDKKQAPLKANSTAYADELRSQLAQLRIELSTKEEKIKSLEKETESLKSDRDYLRSALDKAQDNYSETIKRLPGAGQTAAAGDRKLTWRERFSGKISSSKG